jgi:hypothetical protein
MPRGSDIYDIGDDLVQIARIAAVPRIHEEPYSRNVEYFRKSPQVRRCLHRDSVGYIIGA